MPRDGKITLVTIGTKAASLKVGSGFCQVESSSKTWTSYPPVLLADSSMQVEEAIQKLVRVGR